MAAHFHTRTAWRVLRRNGNQTKALASMALAFCAAFSAVLVELPTASANTCVLSGPRYQLESDRVEWSMNITSGQSCIRGLRFSNVVLDGTQLIVPPKKGKLKLYSLGFSYKAGSDFEGEDFFAIGVSGMINRLHGNSTIHIVVRSAGMAKVSDEARTQISARRRFPVTSGLTECVHDVWHNLETCGWPGPKNTGVSPDTQLRASSGRTISVDNTVIDGEKITGALIIAAKNVVVRNSWIKSDFSHIGRGRALSGTGVISLLPGASAAIEHNTLDGSNATHAGIWYEGTSLIAKSNNIFGINDGIFSWSTVDDPNGGSNFVIEDNYLHDFTTLAANGHIDGYQTEGASHGIIRHNVFYIDQNQNASISIWNSRADSGDILVESNLAAGSGFLIYAEDYSPSEQNPAGGFSVTNIRFTDNKFSTVLFPCAGYFGVWYPRGAPSDGWHRTGNIILETGENVDHENPHVNGRLCN